MTIFLPGRGVLGANLCRECGHQQGCGNAERGTSGNQGVHVSSLPFMIRLYSLQVVVTIELLVSVCTASLIDRDLTQYQDMVEYERALLMDPQRKKQGESRSRPAGIGSIRPAATDDNASERRYLDGQLLIAMPVM